MVVGISSFNQTRLLTHSIPLPLDGANLIYCFSFSGHLQQSTLQSLANSLVNSTVIHYVCTFQCICIPHETLCIYAMLLFRHLSFNISCNVCYIFLWISAYGKDAANRKNCVLYNCRFTS